MKNQKNNILRDDDIDIFYSILCLCSLQPKLTGFSTREKWFSNWKNKLFLNVTDNIDEKKCYAPNTINYKTAYHHRAKEKSYKTSTIGSLLVRLRNSFAHCNMKYSGNDFIIKDYNRNHNITMYGIVNQELLRDFINATLKNRRTKTK